MSVKTTLNIHKKIMEQIKDAADKTGMSRSEIITTLLMKVMDRDTGNTPASGPVKYQDKDSARMWHRFHITLKEDEYDYFTDLRKILKSSLSRIVADAVKKYLLEVLYGKKSDNCHFQNYIIVKEKVDDVICWRIFWGIPQNMQNFIDSD